MKFISDVGKYLEQNADMLLKVIKDECVRKHRGF